MAKFKVGDFVISNDQANLQYSITRDSWVGIVKEVRSDGGIDVVPLDDPDQSLPYSVDSECFDLYDLSIHTIKDNQLLVYLLEDKFAQIIAFLEDTDTNGDKDIYSSIAHILYDLPYDDCVGMDSQHEFSQDRNMKRTNVMRLLSSLAETCNKELENHK